MWLTIFVRNLPNISEVFPYMLFDVFNNVSLPLKYMLLFIGFILFIYNEYIVYDVHGKINIVVYNVHNNIHYGTVLYAILHIKKKRTMNVSVLIDTSMAFYLLWIIRYIGTGTID